MNGASVRWVQLATSGALLGAFGIVGVACTHGGSSTAARSPADVATFCDRLCGRISSCDSTLDVGTCKNQCANQNPTLGKIRGDVVTSVESCVARKDCRTVLSDQLLPTCLAEARASIAPLQATASFCSAMETSAKQCGKGDFDRAGCLEFFKTFAETTLNDGSACANRKCNDVGACVSAEFALPNNGGAQASADPCLAPPPCPADTPLDAKGLAECHQMVADARCGETMRALLGCSLSHASCGTDGRTLNGVPAACKRELDAAAQCKGTAAANME